MKRWNTKHILEDSKKISEEEILQILLSLRGIESPQEKKQFLSPPNPLTLTPTDVQISPSELEMAVSRIEKAIKDQESIVVYADYDADGVTAGSIMWETLYGLGAKVMPYIPHRVDEGYGLSKTGIGRIKEEFKVSLIVTVDQGISAWEKVEYAKSLGIDVIVTDHHSKPEKLPECIIVHTTVLSGSGVSWFLSKTLLEKNKTTKRATDALDLAALATIGTVADLLPLVGPNRSLVKAGLEALRKTNRVGLVALMKEAGISQKDITTFDVSHVIAPRINAIGRLDHALDALRLLCTTNREKASAIASTIGEWNKERQQLTIDSSLMAKQIVYDNKLHEQKRILFVAHEIFNQGIIGLVAGKLVEEFYLPSIVLAKGELFSKASARSIAGFNIVEAIRSAHHLLVDVGGHPMAAGFTVETKNLEALELYLAEYVQTNLSEELLKRVVVIDVHVPLSYMTDKLWLKIQALAPFGMGNFEPVFSTERVTIKDVRLIGKDGRHIKLKLLDEKKRTIEAVGFGMGEWYPKLLEFPLIDIAYSVDMNEWNGSSTLQLKIKDLKIHETEKDF